MKPPASTGRLTLPGKHVLVLGARTRSLVNFRGRLLESMVEGGHRVTACAAEPHPPSEAELKRIGVEFIPLELHRAGADPRRDLSTLTRLYRMMSALRPDVFLGYTIKPVVYGSLAARMAGVGERYAIITGLGYAFGETGPGVSLLRTAALTLYRLGLNGCRKVFFQNPDDLALFRRLGIVKRRQIVLVNGSGVDLEHFAPVPLPPGPPVFLSLSRLIVEKGVHEYVAAAREVKRVHPEAVFRLAGAIDRNPNAVPLKLLEEWKAEGLIEFLGLLEDVRPALARCSVYVLPSYYREGTPRSVLEALATGRAVITSNAPGCRETVRHGENGFLVPPRQVPPLVDAMLRFIEEPELIATMGARSLDLARSRYEVGAVNRVMLEAMGLEGEEVRKDPPQKATYRPTAGD